MEEAVSRVEFEALKKAVEEAKGMLCELAKLVAEPRTVASINAMRKDALFKQMIWMHT